MKSISLVADYFALAFVLLFFLPVTLWMVINAGIWLYGVVLFPAVV